MFKGNCEMLKNLFRKITIIFALMLYVSLANAAIEVIATGVGHDRPSAIKEAQRAAISQGVGLTLEARQITEDHETIKLRIVTSSEGFIQRYSIVSEGASNFGYTVEILAFVNEAKLKKDIEELLNDKQGMKLWRKKHFSNRKVMVVHKTTKIIPFDTRLEKTSAISRRQVEASLLNKGIRVFDNEQTREIIREIYTPNERLTDADWLKLARKHGADTLVFLSDEVGVNSINLESMNVTNAGISKISYRLSGKVLETSSARLLARASNQMDMVYSGENNLASKLLETVNKTAADLSFTLLVGVINSTDALKEVLVVFNDFSEEEKGFILDSVEILGFEDGEEYREQEFSEKTLKLEFFDKTFNVRKFRRKLSKELKKHNILFVTKECVSSRCIFSKKH